MECLKCKKEMADGFSCANSGLSWVESKKFESYIFKHKDLAEAGFKTLIPWKGEFFKAFNCAACKIVLIDYSQKYDRRTIESTCS